MYEDPAWNEDRAEDEPTNWVEGYGWVADSELHLYCDDDLIVFEVEEEEEPF